MAARLFMFIRNLEKTATFKAGMNRGKKSVFFRDKNHGRKSVEALIFSVLKFFKREYSPISYSSYLENHTISEACFPLSGKVSNLAGTPRQDFK